MRKCSGIKPDGTRCGRIVGASQSFCYSHDPAAQEARRKAAAKGGKAKAARHSNKISEIAALRARLWDLAEQIRRHEVRPGVASVMSQIFGLWLKTFDYENRQVEIDLYTEKLEEVERYLSEQRRASS